MASPFLLLCLPLSILFLCPLLMLVSFFSSKFYLSRIFFLCYKNLKPPCSTLMRALILSPPLFFPPLLLSARPCITASALPLPSIPPLLSGCSTNLHTHRHAWRIIPPAKFTSVVLYRCETRQHAANSPPPQ